MRTFGIVETLDRICFILDWRSTGESLPTERQIGDIRLVVNSPQRHAGEGAVDRHQIFFGIGDAGDAPPEMKNTTCSAPQKKPTTETRQNCTAGGPAQIYATEEQQSPLLT
jgi:hypothetical protein